MEDLNLGAESATHLCVLVHGVRPPFPSPIPPNTNPPSPQQLWGNPTHMLSIAKTLRAAHPPSSLYILLTTSNSGMHTYDGIHTCGERVCHEIEQTLALHPSLVKLSVVGYSLGGLVARYAIGLLHAQGTLDALECKNFAAFASPFLGVRSPRGGWRGAAWNFLGSRTLAASGRQLFGEDGFEGTGRPLVEVLADGRGVFARGLGRFGRRTVYANVVNDRTAEWYTTGVDRRDPWGEWLEAGGEGVRFVEGYEDVVLEPVQPALVGGVGRRRRGGEGLGVVVRRWVGRAPLVLALVVLIPIGVVGYFINAGIQTRRSSTRVKEHEKGLGVTIKDYRSARLWMDEIRERVVEDLGGETLGDQEYLGEGEESGEEEIVKRERRMSIPERPTLALAPYQFKAIEELDKLGFRKYPVWIHKVRHSHAAIVVRSETSSFAEGQLVLNHWVKEEFLI